MLTARIVNFIDFHHITVLKIEPSPGADTLTRALVKHGQRPSSFFGMCRAPVTTPEVKQDYHAFLCDFVPNSSKSIDFHRITVFKIEPSPGANILVCALVKPGQRPRSFFGMRRAPVITPDVKQN